MANSYKSYILSEDKQSWIQVFDQTSYNSLEDVPIKNAYGESEDVYVDISSLNVGKYRITGYYKLDDDSDLQHIDDFMFISIYSDSSDPTKKYVVIESINATTIGQTIYTIKDSVVIDSHEASSGSAEIPQIQQDIENLNNDIEGLQQTVTNEISSSISELNETMNSQITSINDSLSNTNESLSSNVTRIDSQVATIDSRLDNNEQSVSEMNDTLTEFDEKFTLLENTEETDGSIRQIAKSYVDVLDNSLTPVAKSGSASDVSVNNEHFATSNVEGALGELYDSVNDTITSSAVTLRTASTPDNNDATTYILTQGSAEVGRVHIAKDLVATQGELVNEDGQGNSGLFIKMTVANGTPFFIPVNELIDIYQGSGDVATVTTGIEVKVLDGVISANIKTIDGAKIDEKTITFAKLAQNVQDKINSIDTVRSELLGNAQTDTVSSKTIEGLVKKTDLTSNTLSNLDTYVGTIPTGSTATNVVDYIDEKKNETIDDIKQYLVWHSYTE